MRTDWDGYFIEIAKVISSRATCLRGSVGAVLVRDRSILSTGYNGSIRGTPHCNEVGCMIENGGCVRTVHAEVNAISQAARAGTSIEGATIYTTLSPCWTCFKQIANAGIVKVVFRDAYRKGVEHLYGVPGIEVVHYQPFPCMVIGCQNRSPHPNWWCKGHIPHCEGSGSKIDPCPHESCGTCHPEDGPPCNRPDCGSCEGLRAGSSEAAPE